MNTSQIISKIVEAKGFEDFIPEELQDSVTPDGANLSVELLIDNEPVKMTIALGVKGKSYSGSEKDGPHGHTLYNYRGFSCSSVEADLCEINGESVPLFIDRITGKPCTSVTGEPTEFRKCLNLSLYAMSIKESFDQETMY